MRRRYRLALAVLLTPVVGVSLVACTGADTPSADPAAEALATALRAGDVKDLPLQAPGSVDVQTQLTQVLDPLVDASGERERTVTVADVGKPVTKDGTTTAVATLDWTWPVGRDVTWKYSTDVNLVYTLPESGAGEGAWRAVWRPDVLVPDLEPGERLTVKTLDADRGDLLDGDGEPMVTERGVWHIGVDKTAVEGLGQESAARELAQLVGLEPNEFFARVEAAGEKAFVEAITIRKKNSGVDFTVDDARDIIGVRAIEDSLELGPTSTFASPVLGRVGEATKEVVEESDGAVQAGDVVGLSGVQRAYDDRLTGSPGVLVSVVPAGDGDVGLDGEPEEDEDEGGRELYRVDAVDGTPVATTLDQHLQKLAENVLDDVDPASAIVAIRPSDGAVLAAASGPGSEGWSTATLGQYPPGSTFKVVDALAMQRAGITPDTEVACPEHLTVDGRTFGNVPGYPSSATGDVPLRTAFAHSCNTAMIGQRDKVAQSDLATAASDLGLVDDAVATPVLGVPAFLGAVPAEAGGTEHAASMIGQGKVQASPLGMATVAASVAAGHRVQPVLVRGEGDDKGDGGEASASPSAEEKAPAKPSTPGVADDEAAVLRDLMHGVVTEGSADMLQDVPGIVGAKTGTAQYGDGSKQHVWMLAIVDDLAVAVFVEDGHRGSDTAGPLMEDFLSGR